jgi:hypothetical protein
MAVLRILNARGKIPDKPIENWAQLIVWFTFAPACAIRCSSFRRLLPGSHK